jgi:hypothetical protein
MMNTKPIPIIITLAAAFISCIMSIVQKVDFSIFVTRLTVVVLIFMTLGTIIKMVLDYSFKVMEPPETMDEETPDISSIMADDEIEETESDTEDYSPESEEGN